MISIAITRHVIKRDQELTSSLSASTSKRPFFNPLLSKFPTAPSNNREVTLKRSVGEELSLS